MQLLELLFNIFINYVKFAKSIFSFLRQVYEPQPVEVDPFFEYDCAAEVDTSFANVTQ